jgi:hypothetical protein
MIKTNHLTGILIASTGLLLTACSNETRVADQGKGFISPNVEINTAVVKSVQDSRAAAEITVSDLSLTLTAESGSYSNTWKSVDDFDPETQFGVGVYNVEAFYGSVEDEGFEKPAYYGSSKVVVEENETSTIDLTASLANTMVSVDYSDTFKNYMTDWSAELHSAGGDYITVAKDEARPAYLRPGTVTLSVSITKPNGQSAKLQVAQFNALARHHYHMTVDLEGGAGDVVMTVKFDDLLTEEPVNIDLSDELMNAPAPTVKASGFENEETIFNTYGNEFSQDLKISVIGHTKLASVTLTTQSDALVGKQGWPAEVNLVNTESSTRSVLESLGLTVQGLWNNHDKMGIINFKNVVSHIDQLTSGENKTTFYLTATDIYGKQSDVISFSIDIATLKLEISSVSTLLKGQNELTVQLNYNGGNVNNVGFQYQNERGTWDDLTVKSITESRATDTKYIVVLAVPATDNDITIRAIYKSASVTSSTDAVKVTRSEPSVVPSVDVKNVWATKATLTATVNGTGVTNPGISYRKKGDSAWTAATVTTSGSSLTANLTGLSAGTTYEFIGTADGFSAPTTYTFTTEAATQLPYSDMETWYSSASGSNWSCDYLGESESTVWGTNNPMTTSSHDIDAAYQAISGTTSTTDKHGGEKAALLRTAAWGSGTTSAGSLSSISKVDAGLLHLGKSRSSRPSSNTGTSGPITVTDLNPGMSFSSRPSALTFWYKYTAKNSADYGVAKVSILDASGNVLAYGSSNLTAQSAYTQVTIPLTYASGAAKAAQIQVTFLSTNSETYLTKSNLSLGGVLNSSKHVGSQLYLDDLSLSY